MTVTSVPILSFFFGSAYLGWIFMRQRGVMAALAISSISLLIFRAGWNRNDTIAGLIVSLSIFFLLGFASAAAFSRFASRHRDGSSHLDSPRSIFYFFSIAFLGLFIATLLSYLTLFRQAPLAAGELGVEEGLGFSLIGIPLIPLLRRSRSSQWRTRTPTIIIPLLTLLSVVVYTVHHVNSLGESRAQSELSEKVVKEMSAIAEDMTQIEERLLAVKAFFDSSMAVDRSEFETFTRHALRFEKSLVAVAWAPLLEHDEMEERSMEGSPPGFSLKEIVPNREERIFSPVYYVEPDQLETSLLGLNLLSLPDSGEPLEMSQRTGELTSAPPFRLEPDGLSLIPLFLWIDRKKEASPSRRLESHPGFGLVLVEVETSFAAMHEKLKSIYGEKSHLRVSFDEAGDKREIFNSSDASGPEDDFDQGRNRVSANSVMPVGDSPWSIEVSVPGFNRDRYANAITKLVYLIPSSLLGAFLLLASGHRVKIEAEVTERTRELGLSRRHFQEISNAIEEVFLVTEGGTGKVIYVNPAYEKIWGRSWEALIGEEHEWMDAIHPDDRDAVLTAFSKIGETGEFKHRYRIIRPDGEELWIRHQAFPVIAEAGNVERVVGVARDVTDVTAAIEEIERSNEELSQFAYVASHDLRDPLRTITNFLQLLQKRYGEQLDDTGNGFIDYAVDGSFRMKAMIDDLLDLSRVQTQGKPLEPTDGAGALQSALDNLANLIEETGTRIRRDPIPTVLADEMQLVRLFQNLISNAIKFGGPDPKVEISVRNLGRICEISITDQGIGIEPGHQEQIFNIFQRLQKSQEIEGTGIGLAVCRRIVERHGGSIGVESKPGEGSRFYFTLKTQPAT